MARLVIAEEAILDLHRKLQSYKAKVGENDTLVPFARRRQIEELKG
ncbi:hypothetical protein WCE34_13065 [Luteimonas sp. MJ204]